MPRARRPLLAVALALLAAAPAWAASIMHGFADLSSMTLWVQTDRAARVVVELHPETDPGKRRRVEGATRAEDDFAVALRLAGLDPGTRYRYTGAVDGKPVAEPWSLRDAAALEVAPIRPRSRSRSARAST